MQEQTAPYVARDQKPALPPPVSSIGLWGAARRSFFATPVDTVLTLLAGAFVIWASWNIFQWSVLDAVFTGNDRQACLVEGGGHGGACWAFVKAKFGQFIYGTYPLGERWRVDLACILLVILAIGLLVPRLPYKRANAVLLFLLFPFVALILLTGGDFSFSGGQTALVFWLAAVATFMRAASDPDTGSGAPPLHLAFGILIAALLALLISNVLNAGRYEIFDIRLSGTALLAFLLSLGSLLLALLTGIRSTSEGSRKLSYVVPLLIALGFLAAMTVDYGLPPIRTSLWGGLLLTLVVALTGIAASLPLGIVLALGRRSDMPAVRFFSIVFIEFWRGVPLITVLFMANFMLPLFLPDGVTFDQLLRVLVGVTLFSSAYMAEVIRGGLQAIPKGQYEGADAMALTYWQKMRIVILPQALKLVIPGIVNTFIGLFKDTSLVYIIGLADLLGTVRRGFNDPNWITPATPATGLIFAAFVYWLFCFSMSRYSIYTERRLDTGHKR